MEYSLNPLDNDKASNILEIHYPYYKKLNAEQKQVFVTRVMEFISKKSFITKENVDVTAGLDNIKVLISAAAIQLTFGLDKYLLDHFSKIFIYPSEYYNRMTKHWHKGETNVLGAIVFSWKDLQAVHDNDGINLGLHEMAHALLLGRKFSETNEDFFNLYFDKWWAVSNSEFLKLEKHENSMFRDYGGTNPQEFFAVCTECFFEIPERFKQEYPEIYRQTCVLLNQDPSVFFGLDSARKTLLNGIGNHAPRNLQMVLGESDVRVGEVLSNVFALVMLLTVNGLMIATRNGFAVFISLVWMWLMYRVYKKDGYGVFYFYDNALVIGVRRIFFRKQVRQLTLMPQDVVKITLMRMNASNTTEFKFQIIYTYNGNMVIEKYSYRHLSDEKKKMLESIASDFCKVNQIAFSKEIVY